MVEKQFTTTQLDALREVANIGSGHAAGDLSEMLGHSFDISVPRAVATPLGEAMDVLGGAEAEVATVAVRVIGDVEAVLVAVFPPGQDDALCGLLGIDGHSEMGNSVLGEVGNVLACAYANVLSEMSGLEFDVEPPQLVRDMMGAIVSEIMAGTELAPASVLLVDTDLRVQGSEASLSILFVPTGAGIDRLFDKLGVN